MKSKALYLILFLCLITLTLCGCAAREQTVYEEAGNAQRQTPQPTAVRQADALQLTQPEINIDYPDDYDAYADEEEDDGIEPYLDDEEETEVGTGSAYALPVDSVYSRYAGSTPIPLDPVDMPTPTPPPELEFEYETYDAAIGYSFEAPVGWIVDQDDKDAFVIRDPETRDNVNGTISLSRTSVSATYRANDLKSELTNRLNDIQRHYVGWQIWNADERKLLGGDGIYNIYRGTAYDGTLVRGLVHLALVDRYMVCLQFSAPGQYNTSYQRVYNKIRQTIK